MSFSRKLNLFATLVLALAASGVAQLAPLQNPEVDSVLRELSRVRSFHQVAISPDGSYVAWVAPSMGRGYGIFVGEVQHPEKPPLRVSAPGDGAANEHDVAWAPDSRHLAFLSDAGSPRQPQLYMEDIPQGSVRQFTNLTGSLDAPSFSPDGKQLAFLFIENFPRMAGPLAPMTPDAGVVEQHIYEQRIMVADLRSGAIRAVSPPDLYVYEYDWAPDGSGFAATAAKGSGDNNWWVAELLTIDLHSHSGPDSQGASDAIKTILKPQTQIANPRFSPDGNSIAFIGGLMSDQGVTGGDVYLVPVKRPAPARNLTPAMQASATWLAWAAPDRIVFTENVDGNAGVAAIDTMGKLTTLWTGAEALSANDFGFSLSLSRRGEQSAAIRSSWNHPPEIWVGAIGAWKQFTRANSDVPLLWGEQRNLHWTNDGLKMQGWLLFPRHYNPASRYPLIVNVHGGPASACTAGWPNFIAAPLAATGYFVLCPNPRGSYGQGESFTRANVKDLGGGDFRDIMAGLDQAIQDFPVDKNRLGIFGWSYGGYMTMWAESHTRRFGAAVAVAGLSNFQSYYGENDIDQWMIPYFGASVYDNPAVYARSSPINFVKQVRTPTLILVGDRDGEVPAPQSYEWYHALKTLGVPVQFVVYPDEGHAIAQPEHRRDIVVRTIGWFGKYLSGEGARTITAER